MAKTNTIPVPQTTISIVATLLPATGFSATNPGTAPTNTVLVATSSANDSVIKALLISTDDSAAKTIQFWKSLDGGTTKYLIGTVVVAALSGTATLINVDVLGNSILTGLELDETGHVILRLQGSGTAEKIYACVLTAAVTASKTVWITGTQLDY